MKLTKIEDYTAAQILLLIVIIILLTPLLLTLPAIIKHFDFSTTGQIGDTIGGITAPFINGLAAVLVFIAFKAQIKANEIFKNQEKSRNILDQITLIQEDKIEAEKFIIGIKNRIGNLKAENHVSIQLMLNKVIYFASEIRLAYELIEDYTGEKDFLYRKLYYLYVIRYKDILATLETDLKKSFPYHKDYEWYVSELLLEINYLNHCLNDVNSLREKRRKER